MRRFAPIAACAALTLSPTPARTADARVTLTDAYREALARSETLAAEKSRALQAEETLAQAHGAFWPTLSLVASYQRQDTGGSGSSATSAFRDPNQSSAKLTLAQPLFRGFADFAALRAAGSEHQARLAAADDAARRLYVSVAEAYYGALAAEQDLATVRTLLDLASQRVDDLRKRERIGRSREGEVLAALAQQASLRARLEGAEAAAERARTRFGLVTGLPAPTGLEAPPEGADPAAPGPLAGSLARLSERPDLRALEEGSDTAAEGVAVARGGHWPSVDLAGNYYLKRTGVLESTKWDASLSLTLPLFQGGVVSSQVRQAAEAARERELALAGARRSAEADLADAHRALAGALARLAALREATTLAERNYQAQLSDYRLGLVSNLDVIQALNSFHDARRELDAARFEAWTARAALDAAEGGPSRP